MSNSIQNKMYNHAETPPETVWNAIFLTLNELAQEKNTKDRLKDFEITPPSEVWNKITDALDENTYQEIKEAVLQMEVMPPASAWNKIDEQLNEQSVKEFSTRVYDYEVMPAATNWQKIASSFNSEQAKIIDVSGNYNKVIRIAAAAAVIGILAWAGYNLLNNSANNNLAINNTGIITVSKNPVIKIHKQPAEINENKPVVENNIPSVKAVPAAIKKIIPPIEKEQHLTDNITEEDLHTNSDAISFADTKSLHKKNTITFSSDKGTEARYLVYLTDQGNMMKLSKKLADLKCIYTKDGEVSQQALAKLDQSQCNDQVKYWQEKIANASLQSSSNPLELIEILQ